MSEDAVNAWILPLAESMQVAIGEQEMAHIMAEWVQLHRIPRTPAYCNHALLWQGRALPVFDIYNFIRPSAARTARRMERYFLCIVVHDMSYNDGRDGAQCGDVVGYGALLLSALPYRAAVSDAARCDYPREDQDEGNAWARIGCSCFHDVQGRPTPIIDLQRLFASSLV